MVLLGYPLVAGFQAPSALDSVMPRAIAVVFGPRSFEAYLTEILTQTETMPRLLNSKPLYSLRRSPVVTLTVPSPCNTPGKGRDGSNQPSLQARQAFVVQLHAEAQVEDGYCKRWVEHLVSRQATHFASLEALLAFIVWDGDGAAVVYVIRSGDLLRAGKIFTGLPLLLIVGATVLSGAGPAQAQNATPNIVFVMVDNYGWGEPGVYGGGTLRGAPTPHIDQLVSDGLRLLNFNVES